MKPKHLMATQETETLPPGYRMTELGPLPEEWRVVRLGEVASIGPARVAREHHEYIPFIPMSLIPENGTTISRWELRLPREVRSGVLILEGDFLLSKITPCLENGKQGVVRNLPGGWGYATTEVFPIRPNSALITEFLALYLLQPDVRQSLASKMEGTTGRRRLPKAVVQSLQIPLPPLPEQRAIAYVLRTVQESKEATERVITVLRELKKSLMRHLFTYGPVPVDATDRVELKETEIGPLPAHWRVVRLGEVVELRKGTVSPAEVPEARYVGLEHIDSGEIRIRRFGKASDTRSAKAIFHAGDILYGKLRPYLDKAALAEWDGVCSTDILVLISTEAVDRTFAAYLMHTDFVLHHAIATTTGVNHPRTSWKSLSQATIPLPPLPEQQEIARMLQAVDARIEAEEKKKAALEALFKTLLHHLMTAKIRLPEEFVARFAEVTP